MKTFKVIVTETQSYEVYVKADTQAEAEDIACEVYGEDGFIFNTDVEVFDAEEVK